MTNSPPTYDGEVRLCNQEIKVIDDGREPARVSIYVDLHVAMNLPGPNGLELRWQRKGCWFQVPVEQMWMLAEGAQVPLRVIAAQEKHHDE